MTITHAPYQFIPQVFDANIMRTLEDNLVLSQLCKGKVKTEGKGAGDTVFYQGLADATMGSSLTTLSHEALIAGSMEFKIDQAATFAFTIPEIDSFMSNADLEAAQASRAAYQLKDTIEKAVLAAVAPLANSTITDTTCDPVTILGDFYSGRRVLKSNNVPDSNMFAVISPWIEQYLRQAGIHFSINEGINGSGMMNWSKDLGFDMFVTNTIYDAGTVDTPAETYAIMGSYDALAYGQIQMPTRHLPVAAARAINVDGAIVYGYKVIRPKELVMLDLTYAAYAAM